LFVISRFRFFPIIAHSPVFSSFSIIEVAALVRNQSFAPLTGESPPDVCRALAVSVQTFDRWRKEFGGLKLSQAQRLRGLERENVLLRHLVADLALANQQLKDQPGKDS
jgi:putative transposase